MKPAPFDYLPAKSLDEALEALGRNPRGAKLIAGGQSLVPMLNLRLLRPALLVDLNGVPGLDGIAEVPGGLVVGAATRQSAVERSAVVREKCPVLPEAIRHIGHAAIRHRGTIGGSLAHADPAAELPAVALALDAELEIARNGASRTVPAHDFFVDYLTTVLRPEEILLRIRFPALGPRSAGAVEEIARRRGDFAIAGVVTVVELDGAGRIARACVALFGVAPVPVRARAVESALAGGRPGPAQIREAAALVDAAIDPPSDIHASSAYRRRVASVLTARALGRALERAEGGAP
ncbi:MAG TPA: xanthine dehydrogenase family protein subunit M [candidate division Zixibacteria bacterium]|nr:xanthine dehydrogenase family protein subunit M [candidate division Zixibacteria bacterium]